MFFPRMVNRAIITWFGCGRVPVAPGTAGSVGALPLCWVMAEYGALWMRISVAVGMTAIAILGSAQDQKEGASKDPQYIVVDEVAGMLWSTLLIGASATAPSGPRDLRRWVAMLIAFGLFRIFDVLKPFPANLFDRASKTSTSWFRRGAHIVLDDVVAGFYALGALELILYGYSRWR